MRRILCAAVVLTGCIPFHTKKPPVSTAERIAYLIAHIDEHPDPAHCDYTPAVHELTAIGEPAIGPTLELMLSDNEFTREHAYRVLYGITIRRYGFLSCSGGWTGSEGDQASRRFWKELGDLSPAGPEDKRWASVQLWRKWLVERHAQAESSGEQSPERSGDRQ